MHFSLCYQHIVHAVYLCVKHLALVPYGVCSLLLAVVARYTPKAVDIGLGPEPLINQRWHKLACQKAGYSAETFVTHLFYYTSDFDYICRRGFVWRCMLAWRCLFRYRALFFYFKGGPFAWTGLLRLEPWIYKIAGTKVLVTGYGGDCQDWNHCPSLLFKHAMNMDYPHVLRRNVRTRQRIDRWTRHADYILSGCDWVYYTPRWDGLCLAHFTVDTDVLRPQENADFFDANPAIVLHAPNHETIKGSHFVIAAVRELQAEGYAVELNFVRQATNEQLHHHIRNAHVVVDQLVIGWYGMFAVEGMSAGKPVLCYLNEELLDLYAFAGVANPEDIPVVNCTRYTIKEKLRYLLEHRADMAAIARRSRAFAERHHSLEAMAHILGRASRAMGLEPRVSSRCF